MLALGGAAYNTRAPSSPDDRHQNEYRVTQRKREGCRDRGPCAVNGKIKGRGSKGRLGGSAGGRKGRMRENARQRREDGAGKKAGESGEGEDLWSEIGMRYRAEKYPQKKAEGKAKPHIPAYHSCERHAVHTQRRRRHARSQQEPLLPSDSGGRLRSEGGVCVGSAGGEGRQYVADDDESEGRKMCASSLEKEIKTKTTRNERRWRE
ncbi:hypothetical protein B0H19DRAFT_1079780 [Mycena capillaripes]|nr:hypothetical protein B0H19DRAFT_1079780 [Mycena capillaripes]